MKQILLMIAMAPSSDQIGGIIFGLLAYLCPAVCLLGGLVILILRFVNKKVAKKKEMEMMSRDLDEESPKELNEPNNAERDE
jgi:hypothetical protein